MWCRILWQDASLVNLSLLMDLAERHDCLLLVDEADSIGVLGATGRGIDSSSDGRTTSR